MAWVHVTALLLLCVSVFCLEAYVFDSCGYNEYMLGKTCYKFRFKDKLQTWETSEYGCTNYPLQILAEPRNQAEKKALRDLIKAKGNDYWIGLKRINGIWKWTGSEETYNPSQRDLNRDWISGSPSNGTDEVCVYASACNGGKWAEAPCNLKKRTICMDKTKRKKRNKSAGGHWGSWGSCSKTCGTGIRTREKGGDKQFRICKTQNCSPKWATCAIGGDPHYITFDVQHFDFQGGDHKGRECKFLLAGRCQQASPLPPFKILAANSHRGDLSVSWVKAIELHYNGHVIRADYTAQYRWFFQVDDTRVTYTPYTRVKGVTVTKYGNGVRLSIENESVYVTYNGHRRVVVGVKSCFRGNNGLCGLCGNYDGNQANDLYLRNGTPNTSGTDLGWSYQEPDKHGHFCHKENVQPCQQTNCRHAKPCDVLNDRHVFGSCPSYYNARHACAIDMCCAPSRSDICDVLREYVKECARLGHPVPSGWEGRSGNVNCAGNRRKIHPNVRPVADEVVGEEESWK